MTMLTLWFLACPTHPILVFCPDHRVLDTALRAIHCGAEKVELAVQSKEGNAADMIVWTAVWPYGMSSKTESLTDYLRTV